MFDPKKSGLSVGTHSGSIPNEQRQTDDSGASDNADGAKTGGRNTTKAATIQVNSSIHATILENSNGARLVKTFGASQDGRSFIEGPPPRQEPQALARDIDLGPDEHQEMLVLRDELRRFTSNQCLLTGSLPPGSGPVRPVIYARPWAALPEDQRALDGDGPLARNKVCFYNTLGAPALLGLDFDVKDMPGPERRRLKADGDVLAVLRAIDPQLKTAGLCVPASAKLIDTRTHHRRAGSMHVFVGVQNADDVGRWLTTVHAHFILRGYGFVRIAKDGKMEVRTPLDLSASGKAERWWFEGEPQRFDAGHGMHLALTTKAQDRAHAGPRVDTALLPDLTDNQRRQCTAIMAARIAAAQPEADKVRQTYAAQMVARGIAAGLTRAQARARAAEAIEGGRLDIDASFKLDDGTWRSGRDILKDVEAIDGMTGADPLEPDYGGGFNRALWFTRAGEAGIFCNSRAHHGREFHLAYDAPDIIAAARGLSGTVPEQLAALGELYRQYLPVDFDLARGMLASEGIPPSAMLDFSDPNDLFRDKLLATLMAQDWDKLAGLRAVFGRFFEQALNELREEDEDIDLELNGARVVVDWNNLPTMLNEAAAARCEDQDNDEDKTHAVVAQPGPVFELHRGIIHDPRPQEWVANGILLRGAVSMVFGPPNQGKSLLLTAWTVALALGASWGGLKQDQPRRVLTLFAEEDDQAQSRRLGAAALALHATAGDLDGQVYRLVCKGVGTLLAAEWGSRNLTETQGWAELVHAVRTVRPDVLVLDPLIELHNVEENDNTQTKAVIARFRSLAQTFNLAVVLSHHTRKGEVTPGSLDMARGASAIGGAVRIAFSLVEMSEKEAETFGIPHERRRRYVRLDEARNAYAPPAEGAEWFEKVSYRLPSGADAPALHPWPLPVAVAITPTLLDDLVQAIGAGCPAANGLPWSPQVRDKEPRSIRHLFRKHGICGKESEKEAFEALADRGVRVVKFDNPTNRLPRQGYRTLEGEPSAPWLD
jgi:hypothetical protein